MIGELYRMYLKSEGVSTDTRSIKGGEVFFALRGENYNGNRFVELALEKGCAYAVSEDKSFQNHPKVLLVDDALKTLQELAHHHRKNWNGKVFAITGSNGKTTTKELVSAVLAKKYRMIFTEGNFNNHIGLPLTLLRIKDEELVVLEMGANHRGEIELLCKIAEPDAGLITNIGKAHLEGFGGIAGVEKAKGELYDFLAGWGSIAVVNLSEPRLEEMAKERGLKMFSYALNADCNVSGRIINTEDRIVGFFRSRGSEYRLESELFGKYNFMNMLSAAAVGVFYDVDPLEISEAIASYHPENNRSQIKKGKSNTLILDAYNANPTSMASALHEFIQRDAGKKMLILGDMYELGDATIAEHEKILNLLLGANIQDIILVGGYFEYFSQDKRFPFRFFSNLEKCMNYLSEKNPKDYHILLKGSRKNALEKATILLLDC